MFSVSKHGKTNQNSPDFQRDCGDFNYLIPNGASAPKAELTSGTTGNELKDTNFVDLTPLWFYVLKEADVRQSGHRLGPLGTHLIAGTIVGLIPHYPESYWNQTGSHEGRRHPADGARASGQLVDSIPALLRAALLLEV